MTNDLGPLFDKMTRLPRNALRDVLELFDQVLTSRGGDELRRSANDARLDEIAAIFSKHGIPVEQYT